MPLTQAQQAYGTGGAAVTRRDQRRPALPASPIKLPPNPWGNLNNSQVNTRRDEDPGAYLPAPHGASALSPRGPQQGTPGFGPGPVGSVGGMPGAKPTPKVSPQQAGSLNALQPGIFNGNPANGYPSGEIGTRNTEASPGLGMLQPGPLGARQRQQRADNGMQGQVAAMQPTPLDAPVFPKAPPPVAPQQGAAKMAVVDPNPAMAKMATPAAKPEADGGFTYEGNNGQTRDMSDATWDVVKNQGGLSRLDYITHGENPARGVFNALGMDGSKFARLPDIPGWEGEPQVIAWNATQGEWSDSNLPANVTDKGLRQVMTSMAKKAQWLRTAEQSPGQFDSKKVEKFSAQLNALQALLERYNIYFNPRGTGVNAPSSGVGTPPHRSRPGRQPVAWRCRCRCRWCHLRRRGQRGLWRCRRWRLWVRGRCRWIRECRGRRAVSAPTPGRDASGVRQHPRRPEPGRHRPAHDRRAADGHVAGDPPRLQRPTERCVR
jgi:hypothetical protein